MSSSTCGRTIIMPVANAWNIQNRTIHQGVETLCVALPRRVGAINRLPYSTHVRKEHAGRTSES